MKVNHSTDEENATKLVALLEQIIEDVRAHGAAGAEWKISVETATGEDVRFRYELDLILDRGIAVPDWNPFWLSPGRGAK